MSPDTRREQTPDLALLQDPLTDLRHRLHAHPEASDHEERTAQEVARFLAGHGIHPVADGVGGHGLLYRLDGVATGGRSLLLRADLDALPLHERTGVSHASRRDGLHHACGHDGHATMLAGALVALRAHPGDGTVHALFQPAEETGQGGARVLQDPVLRALDVDLAYAFHNLPGTPLGTALVREGPMACASTGLHIRLEGATSHASEPEHGRNPIPALARLALMVEAAPRAAAPDDKYALATLIHLDAGKVAYGTAAGSGSLRVTVRASSDAALDGMREHLRSAVQREAGDGGFELVFEEQERFPATVNAADAVARARTAFDAADIAVSSPERPYPWSEDFGHITGRWPGALIGLGAGAEHPPLHAPGYDFPDDLILPGVRAWLAVATGGKPA